MADRLACDVREIGLAGVARGCCARPEIYPGEPTYILTKYPLPDCDTSAYHHITKIFSAAERDVRALFEAAPQQDGLQPPADAENCVKVCFQDGEAFERAGGLKKRSGDRWREFVLWDGPFHNHAHANFALVETWYKPYLCWVAELLGRTRICEIQQTLDKNEYLIWQEFLTEVTVGTLGYLLLDVEKPPAKSYLRNPKSYTALVQAATGKVLLKYLKYAGFPSLGHLYCARASDSPGSRGLYAYDFHVFRSTAHKPNRVSYTLQQLATYESVHPKLRPVYDALHSVSPLGRPGLRCVRWNRGSLARGCNPPAPRT